VSCEVFRDIVGRGRPDARHFFQKNLLYWLLCSFVTFVFQKTLYGLLYSFVTFVFQKPLYGLLYSFVTFVFQKNLLYGLLCSFVTFVFQKSALRGFRDVFRDIVGRGRPDVQCLCLVSDVLCLKSCV